MTTDPDALEPQAGSLFIQGGAAHQQLLLAQQAALDPYQYPEIHYQVAKVHLQEGHHAQARHCLDICLHAWRERPEQQARAYLLHATLCYHEYDFAGMEDDLARVQVLSQNEMLLAECEYLRGMSFTTHNPTQAMHHLDQAQKRFLRLRTTRPDISYDVARASLQAARIAFRLNLRRLGWQYHRQAEQAAQEVANPALLSTLYLEKGQALESEGKYDQALAAYQQADATSPSAQALRIQSQTEQGHIAVLMQDDDTARQLLDTPVEVDQANLICQRLLWQGWLLAFRYQLKAARLRLNEVGVLVRQNPAMCHRAALLHGLIAVQEGQWDDKARQGLEQAAAFFERQNMFIETSQAQVLLAWGYALGEDQANTYRLMSEAEVVLPLIGHVRHLTRLYQASLTLLGGWWKTQTLLQLEEALQASRTPQGVRVYAFGAPRIFTDAGELKQRDRYGNLGIKLLIFMLEKREARLWEILAALYPDVDPDEAQQRFHTLMHAFKKTLGVQDWCIYVDERQMYMVRDDFPRYYDGADFNACYQRISTPTQPAQRIAHCLKLIDLYDDFAATLEGDSFDDFRLIYEARFHQALLHAETLLPTLKAAVPPHWLDTLNARLSAYNR